MTDKAYAVPLHEQLASVPRNARLVIEDTDGMGTRFIPVGRMCHEAADALRARLAQPEPEPVATLFGSLPVYDVTPQREWQGLTDKEIADCEPGNVEGMRMLPYSFARAIEAKLKEKNT